MHRSPERIVLNFSLGIALMPVMPRDFVTPDTPSAGINLAVKGFLFQRVAPDIQSMKSPQSFTGTAGNFNQPSMANCCWRFNAPLA
jgi:hypothetical protein